jgi:tetratricopeptide (TPR) repeat protein
MAATDMSEALTNEQTIRDYLLGRVSDETTLEAIEDRLFTDEEFCSQVALAEDELINDFVLDYLNATDATTFQATLAHHPERRSKVELTQALRATAFARKRAAAEAKPSFFTSLKAFFSQPKYVGAFAVVLIAILVTVFFLTRKSAGPTDDLADLRAIYQKERPTESRITEFAYAPLSELRGEPPAADQKKLRRIELTLIEATEKNPGAQTHHALGVFRLTQRKYAEAIKEFESALVFGDNNAKLHNDLGSAYFELSKSVAKEKKLDPLARSIDEFTRALQLDPNLLEALFNRSLALQELGDRRKATESWNLYLQKDPASPWAEEARKNLARIASEQTLFKSDGQVLTDFLAAWRAHDDTLAAKIHNETKGALNGINLALQISSRYLLARQAGSQTEARDDLAALNYIGRLEREQNSEFFFLN